jgi:hypothetical protein
MKPNQVSARLRLIAAKIDSSKQPSRSLVASDLKKVVAALATQYKLDRIDYVTGNDVETSMADFNIEGITASGLPFKGVLSLDLDGRDMDWDGIPDGMNEDLLEDLFEPLLGGDDVYGSEAYKQAVSEFQASLENQFPIP